MTDSTFDDMLADLNDLQAHIDDSEAIANIAPDRHDEVLAFVTVDQILAGHNLNKGSNTLTSKNQAVARPHEILEMERAARERMRDKRRKQIARARVKRAAQQAERDARPIDSERLAQAFAIIALVVKPISKITMPLYNRFRRVLGDTDVHDIGQRVTIAVAESLARSDNNLDELLPAAQWLADAPMDKRGYDVPPDAPDGARMLVGTIVRIAHRSVVDTYRERTQRIVVRDPVTGQDVTVDRTMESFELLDTMARNIGTNVDALIERHTARSKPSRDSKPPTTLVSKLFARVAIDAWIDGKDLSWCADLMLSDEHTRTDGSFRWTEFAPVIFDGFGMPTGDLTPALLAGYAKRMTRLAFKELPDTIMAVRALANDPQFLFDVTRKALDINVMGQQGVALTQAIMEGDKPQALASLLDQLADDLDQLTAPRAQWRRRRDIEFPPNLAAAEKDLQAGKRFFLVGMEDGDAPVMVYQGPDSSEWRKIFKSEPSQYACEHGQRTYVRGATKKPKKNPRVWHGHFCSIKGDGACDPVFRDADVVLDKFKQA